jgi:hypothetical protein
MQQLDIFEDSRDRVLVNTLADSLMAGDVGQARAAATALQREFPADPHLPPAALLTETLAAEQQAAGTPLADLASGMAACGALQGPVAEAARHLLGGGAAASWLAERSRALARRAAALPFDPGHAPSHAAALFLAGRAWAEAAAAVAGIEAWRRKPQPLDWMAQAHWRLHGQDATWPLLAELAWLAPQRMPALLRSLGDPRMNKLLDAFEAFEGLDEGPATAAAWPWWPAWLLVQQPLLAGPLETAQTPGVAAPERCFKLLQSLLRLERQGRHHDIVALRRDLQGLNPALFAAYMATR